MVGFRKEVSGLYSITYCCFIQDLREEKTQVRLLSQKLSDMRERHQAKDERMEDELRALNTRHERDLAQLKRKFRLEKQDEIEKMMEKVTNDLKRQQGLDRTRSSEQVWNPVHYCPNLGHWCGLAS